MAENEVYQLISFPTLPEPSSSYLIDDMVKALAIPSGLPGSESFSAASTTIGLFNAQLEKEISEVQKFIVSSCVHHAIYHMLSYDAKIVYGILWETLEPEVRVKPILAWHDGEYNTNEGEVFLLYHRPGNKPTFRLVVVSRNESCYLVLTYISHRDRITFEERGSWDIADPRCFELLMEKVSGISNPE